MNPESAPPVSVQLGLRLQGERIRFSAFKPRPVGPLEVLLPFDVDVQVFRGRVLDAEFGFGYLSKNLIAKTVGRKLLAATHLLSKFQNQRPYLAESLMASALESLMDQDTPPQVRLIRNLMNDFGEAQEILGYFFELALSRDQIVLAQWIGRKIESARDLSELMTGSRLGYTYFFPGGVRWSISQGFRDRLLEWMSGLQALSPLMEEFFFFSSKTSPDAMEVGVVKSGRHDDLVARSGVPSTVLSRWKYAYRSLNQVQDKIQELLKNPGLYPVLPRWDFKQLDRISDGEGVATGDTWRGSYMLHVSVKQGRIQGVSLETPSHKIKDSLREALIGARIDEVLWIVKSMGIHAGEIDL